MNCCHPSTSPRRRHLPGRRQDPDHQIEAVVRALAAYDGLRVVVVDDNSTDGTAAIADELSTRHDGVSVIHRPGKAGLGSAYRHGFAVAIEHHADVILEMDADLSHQPESIPRLVEQIRAVADLAIGSRYVAGGGTVGWPLRRQLLSRLGNVYVRMLTHTPVRDATGGFVCRRHREPARAADRERGPSHRAVVELVDLRSARPGPVQARNPLRSCRNGRSTLPLRLASRG